MHLSDPIDDSPSKIGAAAPHPTGEPDLHSPVWARGLIGRMAAENGFFVGRVEGRRFALSQNHFETARNPPVLAADPTPSPPQNAGKRILGRESLHRMGFWCGAVLEDEVPGLPKDEEVEEGVGDDGRVEAARPLDEAMGGQRQAEGR